MPSKPQFTLEEAKDFLAIQEKDTTKYGLFWVAADGTTVADGYFEAGDCVMLYETPTRAPTKFSGEEARALRLCSINE